MKSEILGVKIDNLTMARTLRKIEGFLTDGRQHYIVTPNPEFLVLARKDEDFRRILNQADLAVPDGIGLVFASWFLGQPLKQRIAGTDLMEKICQRAALRGWPVFLLGDREDGLVEETAERLKKKYPDLKIEGSSFSDQGSSLKIRPRLWRGTYSQGRPFSFGGSPFIAEGRPVDILFVALGAPHQEKWIVQNLAKIPSVKLAMGVGGAFNFISGRVRRAPKFLRTIGLEWLWRLACQPWRIKRIFRAVVIFPWLVVRSRL